MWSKEYNNSKIATLIWLAAVIFSCSLQTADAAQMSDYCVTPPYIGSAIEPNLLLWIDNSASMYDLEYTDSSNYYCANAANTSCTFGNTCPGAAVCLSSSTTTTTTTTTALACTTDANCQPPNPGGISGDTCWTNGTHKNQCKNATITTTTVTVTPVSCTSDSTCIAITAGDHCNNKCTVTHNCYDATYNNAGTYDGLFSQKVNYCYSSAGSYLTTCTWSGGIYNEFDGSAAMPATCTYGGSSSTTPYVCVNLDSNDKVRQFVASGKFLNWLAMSKFDIEKKILTGGKYNNSWGDLVAETRGCSGRKFIKAVPGLDLTFAIRGGSTSGLTKITSQATEYGQAYIEIYKGTYDAADCNAAMNDWMNVNTTNLGTVQKDTGNCVGASGNASAPLVAYNQTVHDCFWYYNGHGLTNLQVIQNNCVNDWGLVSAASISTPDAPDAICSNVLTHPDSPVWSSSATGFNLGFLGLCYNGTTGNWDAAGGFDANCSYNEEVDFCASIGSQTVVTDPASSNVIAGTLSGVPGFVMESGLFGMPLINDYTSTGGTQGFEVQIYDPYNELPWPPVGLIDKYKAQIRFGAMKFQNNGSASECNQNGHCSATVGISCSTDSNCPSGEKCMFEIPCEKVCSVTVTRGCHQDLDCVVDGVQEQCVSLAKTDGGVLLSTVADPYAGYIGRGTCSPTATMTSCVVDSDCTTPGDTCMPSVGDHAKGLIKSIDDIVASSWTPFAEAFYNAIGYFARTNDYTVSPPTSRSDASFNSLPSPNTAASYVSNKNPSQLECQKNNIMLITDGMSTADQNTASEALASAYASHYGNVSGYDTSNHCPPYAGSRSLAGLSWIANNRNIKTLSTSGTSTLPPSSSSERIFTYVVYNGALTSNEPGLCDPYTLMQNTAVNGGTSLLSASDPAQLNAAIDIGFSQVAAKAASGTAASVLASQGKSGANLIQTVFYPRRKFTNSSNGIDEISWTGRITNLWYWIDPFANTSTIREDDGIASGTTNTYPWSGNLNVNTDKMVLHLKTDDNTHTDYVIQMYFDKLANATKAYRFRDTTGNGVIGTAVSTIGFEDLGYIWEAGTLLWKRDISVASGKRKIYTTIDGSSFLPGNFSNNAMNPTPAAGTADADNRSTLAQYMTSPTNTAAASNIISWVTGSDVAGYRPRKVMMTNIDNTARVWKLGDVINSTPSIVSSSALNSFVRRYGDKSYSDFTTAATYTARGVVFAGGNDGMLHAFKLGSLKFTGLGATEVAELVDDTGAKCSNGLPSGTPTCGQELWAFIPKNTLPYLQYMADPAYCHLYSVDLTPVIFDASIGDDPDTVKTKDSWRTVLIGGMRFGGACKDATTPISGVGYSSYFALDVTDPNNPKLMWEFPNSSPSPGLGFSTSGPAIVRIDGKTGGNPDKNTNGNWFVVFGSGPTGPISTSDHQFLGQSDQNLQLFVLDLKTGNLRRTINTGIQTAFAGSLVSSALDLDEDYQDELVYVPYVKEASDSTWTDGGILRLMTLRNPEPKTWTLSTLIDGVGPVTTAVSKIQDQTAGNLWVYFSTGRYYFAKATASDDSHGQRYLFGIKDPCESSIVSNIDCSTSVGWCGSGCDNPCLPPNTPPCSPASCTSPSPKCGDLTNVTDVTKSPPPDVADDPSFKGWYIALDPWNQFAYPPDSSTNFLSERSVNDPLATESGVVFFTSYKPYTDLCLFGGKSFLWAVQYNTGGAVSGLKGLALVQSSTGAIQQVNLQSALTDAGNRKSTTAIEGLTGGAPVVQSPPPPANRIVHIRER